MHEIVHGDKSTGTIFCFHFIKVIPIVATACKWNKKSLSL